MRSIEHTQVVVSKGTGAGIESVIKKIGSSHKRVHRLG
jgi:hypothetical protein